MGSTSSLLKLSQPAHIYFAIITTAINKWMNGLGSKFVSTFILCYIMTGVFVMNNVDGVIQVISIGLIVAGFVLNTRRLLKSGYLHLGRVFLHRAEYDRAEHYIKMALASSEAIGDISGQFSSLEMMGQLRIVEGKIQEAISYFHSAIEKCEKMHDSLCDNDTFKISFLDSNIRCYRELSKLHWAAGNPSAALYASELSRARALADLMSAKYFVKNQISLNPLTWTGLEGIVAKESNQTFLYVSYFSDWIYPWIVIARGVEHYHRINGTIAFEGSSQHLEEFFHFRSFGVLPEELCEDRVSHGSQPESKSGEEDSHEILRIGNESNDNRGPKMNLSIRYKLIITPLMDYLKGPEIIIVPDRALYQIPFAALTDESGKYLSETYRIRIVPSLRADSRKYRD